MGGGVDKELNPQIYDKKSITKTENQETLV